MKNALTIAGVNVVRLTRDRVGLFFVFVFPVLLILLIGVAFGGGFTPVLGLHWNGKGQLAADLVERLRNTDNIEVRRYDDLDELTDGVQRGLIQAGVFISSDYDGAVRSGGVGGVAYLATPGQFSVALRTTVDSAVADQSALARAARFAAAELGEGFEEAFAQAGQIARTAPKVAVKATVAGDRPQAAGGQFGLGAASQLVLFVFVNSLAGAAALIQSRRLGLSRRMLSTPIRAGTILLGEGLGRFAIAMIQGSFIIVFSSLLFGVEWGNLLGATALIVAYGLVCTGAAMLAGASLGNENQAGALVPVGLGLAALGGCMVPLEIFSPTMQKVAHLTPHAWAIEGFTKLIRTGAGLGGIGLQLAVLTGFGVVLLTIASWRLRRAITA
jgi:linearmycin/streptolysin S transport system permease protein